MRSTFLRHSTVLVGAALLALATVGTTSATAGPGSPTLGFEHARTIATFPSGPAGSFAESMAADGRGGLIVSVTTWGQEDSSPDGYAPNTGQLWRIRTDGSKVRFGPQIRLSEYGQLMGVAVDSHQRVYVARFNFGAEYYSLSSESPRSGVLQVTRHSTNRVMTLPLIGWPNGIAIHGQTMYVSDSWLGAVWRGTTARWTTPGRPWLTSKLLAPVDAIGANGIAYRHDALSVTSYDKGSIVRIPIRCNGAAGRAAALVTDQRVVTADGVAFDEHGRLWVTINGQYDENYNLVEPPALLVVGRHGGVTVVSTPAGALDYPTDLVLRHHRGPAVANGSFVIGTPNVTVLTR